jgi:hypothetical protein
MKRMLVATLITALVVDCASAGEPAAIAALRAKFPRGIPWNVEISDPAGKTLASVQMRITSKSAASCLGDFGADAVRVEFVRKEHVSPDLMLTDYGVAKFTGDKVEIDLTGGLCDAYLIMDGKMEPDGSSTGTVLRFGMSGGHDIGTYRATTK